MHTPEFLGCMSKLKLGTLCGEFARYQDLFFIIHTKRKTEARDEATFCGKSTLIYQRNKHFLHFSQACSQLHVRMRRVGIN